MNIDEKIFNSLLGKTIVNITGCEFGSEEAKFFTSDNKMYMMFHEQNCCESVRIESVDGEVADLIGSEIVLAEVVYPDEWSSDAPAPENADSYTWTFYKLATNKGYVTIRWLGESNGYYSETINVEVRDV
jgi:hypothetical protein